MVAMNVRRLAAVDLYGLSGTRRRRRIILIEFWAGAIVMPVLGLWMLSSSATGGGLLLGGWLVGAGINYVPLTAYATALSRPGALDEEIGGHVDVAELRRYGIWQLWIAVPLALVVFAVVAAIRRRANGRLG
jgi:hypothetical protein